jgi:hypothetical protein
MNFSPFSFILPPGVRVVEIEYISPPVCPVLYYTASSSGTDGSVLL